MMFATIGMVCTVGPCLWAIFGPCLEKCLTGLAVVIKELIKWICINIIVPFVTFCHDWGIFEVAGYVLVCQLVFEGTKMDKKEWLGFMISFCGFVLSLAMYGYSTFLHATKIRSDGKHTNLVVNIAILWVILYTIPLAILL